MRVGKVGGDDPGREEDAPLHLRGARGERELSQCGTEEGVRDGFHGGNVTVSGRLLAASGANTF